MEKIQVVLSIKKETPGTFVYETKEKGVAVKSLYINKEHFNDTRPEKIVVTVEAAS